jgi:hypothetical protein
MHSLRGALIAVPAMLLVLQGTGLSQELQRGERSIEEAADAQEATAAHSVTQFTLGPQTPNVLKFGQQVTVSFSYDTTAAGGVRIFARPMTTTDAGDVLTPNYAACPSPLYAVGSGTGSCTFTIVDGSVTVDKIRIQMWDANQTTKLFQAKLPVYYRFQ